VVEQSLQICKNRINNYIEELQRNLAFHLSSIFYYGGRWNSVYERPSTVEINWTSIYISLIFNCRGKLDLI
jgi:hypothetical protein